jgi:hypothetical protein
VSVFLINYDVRSLLLVDLVTVIVNTSDGCASCCYSLCHLFNAEARMLNCGKTNSVCIFGPLLYS